MGKILKVETRVNEFQSLVEATGLKKKAIAEILGVTPMTISNWSVGRTKPGRLVIEKLRELAGRINQ